MDDDVEAMSREQLIDEVRRLRSGIREHRDSSGQELCWHHPKLWGLLPERTDPRAVAGRAARERRVWSAVTPGGCRQTCHRERGNGVAGR